MLRAFRRPLALVMALVLILSSLSGVVMAAEEETAPFDSFQDISLGQTLTADITAAGGYAYFRFVPEITHSYAFTSDASGDTYGYLYDADGNELTRDDDSGSGNNFRVAYTLTAGETYYFGARWYNSSTTGAFPVSVSLDENGHVYNEDGVCACGATIPYGQWLPCGEDVEYCLSTDGTLTIRGTGAMDYYYNWNGYAPWYALAARITSVVIEEGVTQVGSHAFYGCTALENVTLPQGLTSIGWNAFAGCESLGAIEIPDSVTYIESSVFSACTSLESVTLPQGLTSIGVDTFYNCTSLKSVTFPEGLTNIEVDAFYNCTSLESITLPEGLTSIGAWAFEGCTSLTEIHIPSSVTYIGGGAFEDCPAVQSDDQGLLIVDNWVVGYSGESTTVTVPAGTKGICGSTFSYRNLESITLPEGLVCIGENTFYDCVGLRTVSIPDSVIYVGGNAFSGCPVVQTDDQGLMTVDGWVVGYSGTASTVTVPAGIVGIGNCVFRYNSMESITLPEGLRVIGDEAFNDCSGLSAIELPDSVTNIGSYAFAWCRNLRAIDLPASVTSIGSCAFAECSNINTIYFEGNTPSIASDAWNNVTAFAYYPPENDTWTADAMQDYGGDLTWRYIGQAPFDFQDITPGQTLAVNIPSGEYTYFRFIPELDHSYTLSMSVGGNIYVYDASGVNLGTPGNVSFTAGQTYYFGVWPYYVYTDQPTQISLSLGDHAYNEDGICICGASIPFGQWLPCGDGVEYCLSTDGTLTIRGTGAMDNYDSWNSYAPWHAFAARITSVVIEEGVTSIGEYAFSDCTALESVTLPDGLTSIGWNAFSYCDSLGAIEIPDSVTYIGGYAFYECTALESVVLPDGLTSIESGTFHNCTSLASVLLPEGLTSIGEWAFGWCTSLTEIHIPDSVTYIGSCAFEDCPAVRSDNQGVLTVGNWVVGYNGGASTVTVPAGTKGICASAFSYRNLESVTLPEGLIYIRESAFYNCTGLGTVNIPDSVTYVGSDAFTYCPAVQTDDQGLMTLDGWAVGYNGSSSAVTVPAGIVGIGCGAFRWSGLESVTLPEDLRIIDDYAFEECNGLSAIELPDSVTDIGSYAFAWCRDLSTIDIPASVTSIGSYAFAWCYGLNSIYFAGDVPSIASDAWYGVTTVAYYPPENSTWTADVMQNYGGDLTWRYIGQPPFESFLDLTLGQTLEVEIPTGEYTYFRFIPELDHSYMLTMSVNADIYVYDAHGNWLGTPGNVFLTAGQTYYFGVWPYYVYSEEPIQISVSVNENSHVYDDNGFCTCGASIPYGQWFSCGEGVEYCLSTDGTLTIRGTGTMDNYDNWISYVPWRSFKAWITSVVIEEGVTSVGNSAFSDCTALESVTLPDGLTSIGWNAFSGCESLGAIEIPDSVTYIGGYAFSECTALESVILPDGLTSIESETFYECTSLASVTLPEGLTSIGGWAFGRCTSLTEIHIPDSVTYIGSYAFENCPAAQSDNQGLLTVGNWVVGYNGGASTVTVPAGIKGICGGVFSYRNLQSVTLPEGLIHIGENAFYSCTSLRTVNIPASVTYFGSDAFYNCPAVQTDDQGLMTLGGWVVGYNGSSSAVTVPAGIMGIGNSAFAFSSLQSITLPEGLRIIGDYAFEECNGLSAIELPDSVTNIGSYAFAWCYGLNSIYFAGDAPSIASDAWYGVTAVAYYPPDNDTWTADVMQNYGGSLKWKFIGQSLFDSQDITPGQILTVDIETPGEYAYFRFVPEITHSYAFTSDASGDTYGYLYNAAGEEIMRNDDSGSDLNFLISYTLTAGETYYFAAGWLSSARIGSFSVSLNLDGHIYDENGECICGASIPYGQWLPCGDGVEYCLTKDGALTIRGSGAMEDYNFGDAPWTQYGIDITSVTVEAGVTGIGSTAFYECTALNSVTLPEGLSYIGEFAFSGCVNLGEINIPNSVTTISDAAFDRCISLETITLPEGLTSLGYAVFNDCTGLHTVELPDSLHDLGSGAFWGCTSLESITLPEGLSGIGSFTFCDCTSLRTIEIPAGVENIYMAAFRNCSSLESVTLPDELTYIGDQAFYGCTSLNTINIPDRVSYIGSDAFYGCPFTQSDDDGLVIVDGWVIGYDGTASTVTIPGGVKGINAAVFEGNTSLESVVLPEGLTSIGDYAFIDCPNLTDINIPDSVTSIGYAAFAGCSSLKSIVLPKNLVVIEGDTFSGCTSLESVTVQDGLLSIYDYAFYNCTSLTDINIPDSLIYIGCNVFSGCPVAESDDQGFQIVDGWLIGYNGTATALTVPAGIKGICGSVFQGNTGLESVVLPEGLIRIGVYAFLGCANLSQINIPASVAYIDSCAFAGCSSLESITLPYGLDTISSYTFADCTSLSQINIPASVTVIDEGAFAGCTGIESVTIPASVNYLGWYVFGESGVETITFEGNAPGSNEAFYGITATAYYPAGNATWTEDIRQAYGGSITWIPLFEVIDGADSVLNTSSPEELTIRVNNDYTKFVGVTVDGVEVDPSNYTVSEGSTIVTFKEEYLRTLDAREHDVTVLFTDGAAITTFTIQNSVPGDINGDGKINGKDGILLAQYLAEWNVTINLDAADVNGDGKVNGKDGILLAQYLAEWDVTLG